MEYYIQKWDPLDPLLPILAFYFQIHMLDLSCTAICQRCQCTLKTVKEPFNFKNPTDVSAQKKMCGPPGMCFATGVVGNYGNGLWPFFRKL